MSTVAQRDAAMISLIAYGQNLIARLALLTQAEKDAVLAMIIIGQSLASYADGIQPDKEVIESFERTLQGLSPAMAQRIMPLSLYCVCQRPPLRISAASLSPQSAETMQSDSAALTGEPDENVEIDCQALQLRTLYAVLTSSHSRTAHGTNVAI